MTMTKSSLLAFFLVIIALNTVESIEFPGLQLISDCVETKCGVRMRSCLKANQWELSHNAKGCIVRDCKKSIKQCMKQIPNDAFAYAKAMAEIAEQYADYGLDIFSDSYLQCWLNTDIQNGANVTDCVIDDFLKKMEPFTTLIGSTLFSDPAYMACWIVHTVKVFVTHITDIQRNSDYVQQSERNTAAEAQRDMLVYLRCFTMKKTDEDCIDMWNRIWGTPAWMKRQSKDILVALINDVISTSAKCRKS